MSRIKFGLVIPQGWRWLSNHGDSSIEQYEFSKSIAGLADTLHYHSAYVFDHLWGGSLAKINRDKNFFECFSILTAIIENTKRIRVGQAVTCNPYRSPALISKIISTLDVMSRGRVELGIGAGWAEDEYNSFGFPYPYPSEEYPALLYLPTVLDMELILILVVTWILVSLALVRPHHVLSISALLLTTD